MSSSRLRLVGGHAEIAKFSYEWGAAEKENVGRLEVPVHNTVEIKVSKGGEALTQYLEGVERTEIRRVLDAAVQGELHNHLNRRSPKELGDVNNVVLSRVD